MHVFVKSSVKSQKKITSFLSVAYAMFHNVISRFLFGRTNFPFINHGRFGLSYVKMNSVYYSGSFSNGHSRKRTVLLSNRQCHQTSFFLSPVKTLYSYIPVGGQLHP